MRRLVLLVALVFGMSTLSVPPVAANVPGGAVFNVPPPWGTKAQSYAIINHVVSAMKQTPARAGTVETGLGPQPEILVTSYLLDGRGMVNALIDACRRGASVRVILDKGIETNAAKDLISTLNSDNVMDRNNDGDTDDPEDQPQTGPCGDGEPQPALSSRMAEPVDRDNSEPIGEVLDGLPTLTDAEAQRSVQADVGTRPEWGADGGYLTQCEGSCRGGPGSMHTKFYAFSQTGGDNNVVIVSSSNLNAGGALKGWNDSYTMKGVKDQYDAYEDIHDEMGLDDNLQKQGESYREVNTPGSPFTSRFFPMSNGTKANDPTLNDLNKVSCSTPLPGNTRINIAMFYWQGTRGEYMLDKILALAKAGCVVNIIIGAPSLNIGKRLRAASRARLIKVWDSRRWTKDRVLTVRTHNKYVAIKGSTGTGSSHLVMTGSQNWGHGSLDKSDDSTLNIELASAYDQYLRQWGQVRNHSIRMAPPR